MGVSPTSLNPKAGQGNLSGFFLKNRPVDTAEYHAKGYRRIEKRTRTVTAWLDWMPAKVRRDWLGFRSIVRIESTPKLLGGKVRQNTSLLQPPPNVDALSVPRISATAQAL